MFSCQQGQSPSSKASETTSTTVQDPVSPEEITMADDFFPIWLKNANIYEVNIRQYTEEGTFNAFAKHIPRLKQMGVDILWLMPVYPISKTKRKGTLGSYYSVSDYAKVNPEFGTLEDFRNMVKTIHKNDMKIILDFVPNHTGWDHSWITEHPDYYTKDAKGNIIDPIDPNTGESWGWTDVADLNFDNGDMRKAMIKDLRYWVMAENIDGFRMDVASNVPEGFWAQASKELFGAKKEIFMLAEAEAPELRNKRYFQADYGWEFHHILNQVAKSEAGPKEIVEWYTANQAKYSSGFHMHFTSNHDENSWNGTTEERMGEAHRALSALAFTFDGMPLIYGGQEEPLRKRLEFFEKDNIGFKEFAEEDFYQKLLHIKHVNPALWNGKFGGKPQILQADDQILAYKKQKDNFSCYGIFNLSEENATYILPETLTRYNNVIPGKNFTMSKGGEINLEPWGYMVLSNF